MKYCWKCGLTLNDTARFCERCGSAQNGGVGTPVPPVTYSYHKPEEKTDSNRLVAFIISLVTAPVLFIIGILGRTSEIRDGKTWGGSIEIREYTYLPSGMKMVLYAFLIVSIIATICLRSSSKSTDKSKSLITTLFMIFNVLIALFMASYTDVEVIKELSVVSARIFFT